MHIHPDDSQMAALAAGDPDQPMAMLNLPRFAEQANAGHYQEAAKARDAALADSRLVMTHRLL